MTDKKPTTHDDKIDQSTGTGKNPILGAVDTFLDRSREVIDPIKKVCYPVYETAKKPIEYLSDPVKKICYEPFVVHYEKKYKSRFPKHAGKLLVLDLALLFTIGALVVVGIFAYFVTPIIPQPVLVNLDATVPAQAVSGGPTVLSFSYLNDSEKTIHCADMRIELPQDMIITGTDSPKAKVTEGCPASDQVSDNGRVGIRLGELAPGARGTVQVDGILFGPTGDVRQVIAEVRYWKEAGTEPMRVPLVAHITMAASALEMELSVPETVITGQVIPVTISYTNTSETTMPGASIRLSAPDGFVITGSTPLRFGPDEWRLGDLPPGKSGTVTAWGYLRSAYRLAHSATFTARGYVQPAETRILTERVRTNADPRSSGFDISQRIVRPSGRRYIFPGETVAIAVTYANNGDAPLKDMRIALYGEPRFLAPSEGNTVTWDSELDTRLKEVAPGESGELTASFRVTDSIGPEDIAIGDIAQLSFSTEAEAHRDDPTKPFFADTPADALSMATKIGIDAAAVYFTPQGDQLGRGPLPPLVGETTRVWVFLQATNAMNPVENAVLEATLPEGVSWTGRYSVSSGEALDYLPLTRTIRWKIGSLERFAGTHSITTSAQFELSITPNASQVHTMPVLLTSPRLEGLDTATGVRVHALQDDVTTKGLLDKLGDPLGTVQE